MIDRVRPPQRGRGAGDYFPAPVELLVPSGCTTMDCAATGGGRRSLAGAWMLGKVVNIVGDKSVGKTLLAIEACANFARMYPRGRIRYRESESAFSPPYAASLGLPVDRVDFGPKGIKTLWNTVEDIFEDLRKVVKKDREDKVPSLYIVDSLDALRSREDIGRSLDKGSYGTLKPKLMSQLFAELARDFSDANMLLMFISQIRDRIGATYGETKTRAGGHALDFYSSHVVWLHHVSTRMRTVKGIKRATGVRIRAKFKKNKVAVPFRECEFVLRFNYGVDDLAASVLWLKEAGRLPLVGLPAKATEEQITLFLDRQDKLPDDEYRQYVADLREKVAYAWEEVENSFQPRRRKYA